MAVFNAYVTNNASASAAVAADQDVAVRFSGGTVKRIPFSFEVAAADDNASIYRFARIPANAIITSLKLLSDATAGLTDVQFGIYKTLDLDGTVIDVDAIAVSVDITAGKAVLTEMLIPSAACGSYPNFGKTVIDCAGAGSTQNEYGSVDVAMTTPAGASAAGTIAGYLEFVIGN